MRVDFCEECSLKLMALAFFTMLLLPLASSEDARSMEKYLDCLTDKKADIVFVFDTSNSMGGEINELSAVVRDFATDLGASRIDYRLGLVEFRDFPITCGERAKISCGSPEDFAYKVIDNGTLTAEINTFGSRLNIAGGTWLIKVDVEGDIVRLPGRAG